MFRQTHRDVRVDLIYLRTRLQRSEERSGISIDDFSENGTRKTRRQEVQADDVRDSSGSPSRTRSEDVRREKSIYWTPHLECTVAQCCQRCSNSWRDLSQPKRIQSAE